MLLKPLHSYLRRGLNPAARLGCSSTTIVGSGGCSIWTASDACAPGGAAQLARLSGRKNSRFRLCLVNATTVQTPREGECTICLTRDGDPTPLSRLTFSLTAFDGSLALAIGGLQGPSPGHKREVIEATRDLHGLRPKDATLLAARAIAKCLSLQRASMPLGTRSTCAKSSAGRPKLSSYDNYGERGAIDGGPLGFILPPACRHRRFVNRTRRDEVRGRGWRPAVRRGQQSRICRQTLIGVSRRLGLPCGGDPRCRRLGQPISHRRPRRKKGPRPATLSGARSPSARIGRRQSTASGTLDRALRALALQQGRDIGAERPQEVL